MDCFMWSRLWSRHSSLETNTATALTSHCPPYSAGVDGPVVPLDVHTTQPSDLTTFPSSSPPSKTVRRNRCYVCRKKVGLTGMQCIVASNN